MNTDILTYESTQEIVLRNHLGQSAAYIHGVLAGMLCSGVYITLEHWVKNGLDKRVNLLDSASLDMLEILYSCTCSQINEQDFSFQLFLPDDEHSLGERASALGEWCGGFLTGIGLYCQSIDPWPGDIEEILNDFLQIHSVSSTAVHEEDDFMELTEYVRICSQVVRTDFLHFRQSRRLH